MWKSMNSWTLRALVRNYATKSKRIRDRITVLKQDMSKFPEVEFHRSKTSDRRVYVWGQAVTGACGVNDSLRDQKLAKIIRHPTRMSFAERFDVLDISAGYGFTLFACKPNKEMTLFGCGLNTDAQLGYHKHGGETNRPMELMIYPAPITLPKLRDDENLNIKKVAAGRAHSLALSESGVLFSLGHNAYGQCGRPIVDNEKFHSSQLVHRIEAKTIIGDDDQIKDIVCGLDHSLILTENGKVFSCGWGADGQTGLGHFNSSDQWCQCLGDIENEKMTKIVTKFDCVLALNDKNEVFGWGNSEYSQLDLSNGVQQISTPIHLKMIANENYGKIIDIASSGSGCIILNENGDVFVWGFGILGLGPNADHVPTPTQIPAILFGRNDFSPDSRVSAIYAGFSHFGAVTTNNDLYMWGKNRAACLGLRNENDQFFPLKVGIGAKVLKIDCGVDHTVAYCKTFT